MNQGLGLVNPNLMITTYTDMNMQLNIEEILAIL